MWRKVVGWILVVLGGLGLVLYLILQSLGMADILSYPSIVIFLIEILMVIEGVRLLKSAKEKKEENRKRMLPGHDWRSGHDGH